MNLNLNPFSLKPKPLSPAERWRHDRSLIASWLQREVGGHFDGAEIRADGSSFLSFASPLGPITIHDYWSFCRPDFQTTQRIQSYAQILSRQVPVLTLGYARMSGQSSSRAELVVFLSGEVVVDGYGEVFGPLVAGTKPGSLVAIESTQATPMTSVELYADPFLVSVIANIHNQARKPPNSPVRRPA